MPSSRTPPSSNPPHLGCLSTLPLRERGVHGLADIRQAIDGIDTTLLNSFVERMDIATEVAKSKIEMGKAVFDPARERSKLNNLASRAPERYEARPSPCSVCS